MCGWSAKVEVLMSLQVQTLRPPVSRFLDVSAATTETIFPSPLTSGFHCETFFFLKPRAAYWKLSRAFSLIYPLIIIFVDNFTAGFLLKREFSCPQGGGLDLQENTFPGASLLIHFINKYGLKSSYYKLFTDLHWKSKWKCKCSSVMSNSLTPHEL